MKARLLALDIDGTLTNDEKVMTPSTREALLAAEDAGTLIALASARPPHGLAKLAGELELASHGGILMAYNGGRICEAATGATISETHLELGACRRLLRALEGLPATPILDDGERFYVEDAGGYKVAYECRNNAMGCVEVESLADALDFAPNKLLLAVRPERIVEVQRQVAGLLSADACVMRTAPFYLEVVPRSIDKGAGLEAICGHLGIGLAETAAFGDSENDIGMLRAAGLGVAMGNAEDAVKAAADEVTLTNDEDGIFWALRTWLA